MASRKAKQTSTEMEFTSDMEFEMAPLAETYKFGAPLVDDPSKFGVECQVLHGTYMQMAAKDAQAINFGFTNSRVFEHEIQPEVYIAWEDVFDLFNDRAIDVGIMRVFAM